MPLYEYRCEACRHTWTGLQGRWDSPAPACPACGAEQAQRLLSTFAVGKTAASGSRPGPCGADDCACRGN